MRKDNKLMALLSVWGIILVVLGHSGFEEPIIQQKLDLLHKWIYSFHMPLFFMISGYLFSYTNKDISTIHPITFINKKVQRLLIPYIFLGCVLYVIKFVFSGLSHAERTFTIEGFFKMFVLPGCADSTMGYLWYLLSLFVIFVIVMTLIRLQCDLKIHHFVWHCSVYWYAQRIICLKPGGLIFHLLFIICLILLLAFYCVTTINYQC